VAPIAASGVDGGVAMSTGIRCAPPSGRVDSGVRAAPLEVVAPMKAVDSGGSALGLRPRGRDRRAARGALSTLRVVLL